MTKRMDNQLLLFVVNEYDELVPNLQVVGSENEVSQGMAEAEKISNPQNELEKEFADKASKMLTLCDDYADECFRMVVNGNKLENHLNEMKELKFFDFIDVLRQNDYFVNTYALNDEYLSGMSEKSLDSSLEMRISVRKISSKLESILKTYENQKFVSQNVLAQNADKNETLENNKNVSHINQNNATISLNLTQGAEDARDRHKALYDTAQARFVGEQTQHADLSVSDAVVYQQGDDSLRTSSDRKVDLHTSSNDANFGRDRFEDNSQTTSGDGTKNLGERSESAKAQGGMDALSRDTSSIRSGFGLFSADELSNQQSELSPSLDSRRGVENGAGTGGFPLREGVSNRRNIRPSDERNDRRPKLPNQFSNISDGTKDTLHLASIEKERDERGKKEILRERNSNSQTQDRQIRGHSFSEAETRGQNFQENGGKGEKLGGIERSSTDIRKQSQAKHNIELWRNTQGDEGAINSRSHRIDFTIQREPNLGSLKEKFQKNIKAISLLKQIESECRLATSEEQSILSEFSGWGGLAMAFDNKNEKWSKEYKELLNVFNDEEYKSARNSTQDAFYTPQIVIDTIYKGLDRLGFNNTGEIKNIFEPSVGVGNFLAHAKNHAQNYRFTGTELDKISARLAKQLYQNQDIRNESFEKYPFIKQFDAFIGNPPFGQKKIYDENSNLNNMSVYNYFLAKSIEQVKDDGIVAFVVSKYFLDSKNDKVREMIGNKASFLGAVRLPNNAFSKIANTEVSTDIVFFKKGKDDNIDKSWLKSEQFFDDIDEVCMKNGYSEEEAKSFSLNEYYKKNPQNILGKMQVVSSRFGLQVECVSDGRDLQEALDNFVSNLPKDIYKYHETKLQDEVFILNNQSSDFDEFKEKLEHLKKGNFFVYDNEIYSKISSSNDEIIFKRAIVSKEDKRRIGKFVKIRDEFNKLIKLEKSNLSDEEIQPQRQRLNEAYDSFLRTEGFLNKSQNKKAFKEDVESNKILALEKKYDVGISKQVAKKQNVSPKEPSAQKADIFFKRTLMPKKEFKITNPKEALLASVNQYGYLSLPFLEQNLDMNLEDSLKSLLDDKLIFVNHKVDDENKYVLAQKYLSGNVKAKFKEVEELLKQSENEHLHSNLEALKEVLPPDIKAVDIGVDLGATWIPLKYYKEFFEEKFEITKDEYNLLLNEKTGEWIFRDTKYTYLRPHINALYSATSRWDAIRIAEAGLRKEPIKITQTIEDDYGKERKVLLEKETHLANSKLEKIKNEFADWIFKDYDRRVDLEKIYNERFNTDVEPKYNGESLMLDNFSQILELRPHQKNAIAKAVQERSLIFDHQVGAGKTLVSICTLMQQKQMGLINKPLIVVPNHIVRQWQDSFYEAYPNANVLVAEESDLKADKREQFYSRIIANEYDAIIMTHSQLKLIECYENKEKIMQKQIDNAEYCLDLMQNSDNTFKSGVKNKERKLDNLKSKLKKLQNDKIKSKATDFSELGIDCLVVDEAHEFKNLFIHTTMGNINGLGNLDGSQRATDLYSKTDYIHENDGKLYFLTGTPISNSITELYTLQRYLQPQVLEEKGIQAFDSWASTFGEVSNAWELDSSGVNYKITARFNKFKNVPELTKMYKCISDIVTNKDIEKYEKDFVPKLFGDKPINEVVPRSENVAEFIGIQDENGFWNEGSIVWRMEHQGDDIRQNNLLACTTDARKAGLDYRLINPSAEDFKDSKINKLVDNVYNEYLIWNEDKGTQLVFCDLSTPKRHSQKILIGDSEQESGKNFVEVESLDDDGNIVVDLVKKDDFVNINDSMEDDEVAKSNDELVAQQVKFDVYSDVLKKLVAKGIKQDEIAFIHDAKTHLQKAKLFEDVNSGKIRILLGSTQKMGAGTNVQERVVAIHHLDCPWRPSDLEQRNGRVIRQGNKLFKNDSKNFKIKEFRYATQQTYDARMWQTIESKARSIEQFRQGGANVRTLDDITGTAADAAEMKAEATGNPFILMQVQLQSDLKKEEVLYSNYQKQLFHNEETLKNLQIKAQNLAKENEDLVLIKEVLDKNKVSNFKGKFYFYDGNSRTTQDFSILKDNNSEANKAEQEKVKKAFEKNIAVLANGVKDDIDILEYRGLVIRGERTNYNTLSFYVDLNNGKDYFFPENLRYKAKESEILSMVVSFTGFVARLNNFYQDIGKLIQENNRNIVQSKEEAKKLENITGQNAKEYVKKEYLEALREDNRLIINEIKKFAKNKHYKSNFEPKSTKILQALNTKSLKNEEILR